MSDEKTPESYNVSNDELKVIEYIPRKSIQVL